MKVEVLFFANFRDLLNTASITVELADESTVVDLCRVIAPKGEAWKMLFENPSQKLKVAINQEIAEITSSLKSGDEVAFFPPVTGG
ncbi:molybdopterin converting factor subunit 1 [Aliikangiella sp. IMCC44359]|uniref:molybdopterin converting factor subunit 1 n=1 Tax=Aliikangiella sp. IMCC44359 TaxID=3459125 RepID=UPI00403B2A75